MRHRIGIVTREEVDRWLAGYVEAWKTYDRDKVAELFADDINYRYHPGDDPIVGRDAVVQSWLGEGDHPDASDRDEPDTFEAAYRTVAVDGDRAVATGISSYRDEPGGPIVRVYDNCFVMQFDSEGRCREFTEWFMQRKSA
jgi:ketosteroid isomerase-like protein